MREGFFLGPIFVHWYGVIIMFGAVLAAFLADYEARRRKLETDIIWDVMPWLLIAGVIGARLWHILTPSETAVMQGKTTLYFLTHPLDAINIRSGGLGIPGAVIGGLLALYFYCRKKNASFSAPDWRWRSPSAAGGITSTRSYTVRPPICPGQFSLNHAIVCPDFRMWLITIPCSCMNPSGTC